MDTKFDMSEEFQNEDDFLKIITKSSKKFQYDVLRDCEIALDIISNYSPGYNDSIGLEAVNFILEVDLSQDPIDTIKKLGDYQWKCKIAYMCHVAFQVDGDREYVKEVENCLNGRVKMLKSLLYN